MEELDEPAITSESVKVLRGARIVWFDGDAVRRDFGRSVRGGLSELRRFVLANAAIISTRQTEPNEVNENVPVSGEPRLAYRPPNYGRALVVEARDIRGEDADVDMRGPIVGLLDIKGAGVAPDRRPTLRLHSTGLLLLNQAIEEVLYQKIIETVFQSEQIDVRGVPVYAIVDLGFRGRVPESGMVPCASLVRRAHRRHPGGLELPALGSPAQKLQLVIELVLRRYGITSVNIGTTLKLMRDLRGRLDHRYGEGRAVGVEPPHLELLLRELGVDLAPGESMLFEGLNVQTTREVTAYPPRARIVDFGHYNVADRFKNPLFSLVRDRFLNWGGALWPSNPDWVSPDPTRRIRWTQVRPRRLGARLAAWCGADETTKTTGITAFALGIARDVHRGKKTERELAASIDEFVAWLFDDA